MKPNPLLRLNHFTVPSSRGLPRTFAVRLTSGTGCVSRRTATSAVATAANAAAEAHSTNSANAWPGNTRVATSVAIAAARTAVASANRMDRSIALARNRASRNAARAFDHDHFRRYVVHPGDGTGLHLRDRIDDVHSFDDLGEHRVAGVARAPIEVRIVHQVDEELAVRGIRIVGARHRERAPRILEPIARFILDRGLGLPLRHRSVEATCLHDE